ncbi:MAG: hypothetical protein K0R38_3916, partial [Polyangiaceae bacterium]|nr:hypothetical protein [Polyangiaceae bacterium]
MNAQAMLSRTRRVAALLVLTLGTGCGSGGEHVNPASAAGSSVGAGASASGTAGVGGANTAPAGTAGMGAASTAGGASTPPAVGGAGGTSGSSAGGAMAGTAGKAGGGGTGGELAEYVPISFGTKLEPLAQMAESRRLAQSLAAPSSPSWRAKGDQRRTYRFNEANADIAFRVSVPTTWDGASKLPLVMFLHGASNDESSYLDQNDKQMVRLAEQHGYVLVSPLGHGGAYGNFLRLPADFSRPEEAAKMLAMRTDQTEKTQQLSEKDVINVMELVLSEYPIEPTKMFLMGHSMGSGGTWYIGGKYSAYW